MLKKYIDSVLIIDDKEEEIENLKLSLEDKDIWVTYINPPKHKHEIDTSVKKIRNRNLLFLDLQIDEGKSTIDNISTIIRPLLSKLLSLDFGSYGIVMWTKHDNHIEEFKEKLQNDRDKYQLPLFVVQMDKTHYLQNDFDTVLNDLETKLKESIAANFFINWTNLINCGKHKAITSIFEIVPDYQKQDKNLEFLLFKMAQNYTGIPFDKVDDEYPISIDAIKAFNDLLIANINSLASDANFIKNKDNIFFETEDNNYGYFAANGLTTKKKDLTIKKNITNTNLTNAEKNDTVLENINKEILSVYSSLNTRLLIDNINIQQDKIIPGNVYQVLSKDSRLRYPDLAEDTIPIIIEMTPPCDFSNSKTAYPRVMAGYIKELDLKNLPRKEKNYRDFWPVLIEDEKKPQIIIFDFSILGFVEESDLQNDTKYKLFFRVKDKLFADILQKMSSYTARLGLSIIR